MERFPHPTVPPVEAMSTAELCELADQATTYLKEAHKDKTYEGYMARSSWDMTMAVSCETAALFEIGRREDIHPSILNPSSQTVSVNREVMNANIGAAATAAQRGVEERSDRAETATLIHKDEDISCPVR